MKFLSKISRRFRLEAEAPPSSQREIADLTKFSPIQVPHLYAEIVSEASDVEFAVDGGQYIRIWSAARSLRMNRAYEIQENLPFSLAIGDDERGSALVLRPRADRPGLYLVEFACLDQEEAQYIAPSLEALLVDEVGIDMVA